MRPQRQISGESPKKVALYARYSSELQHERSIDDQLRLCTERSVREGWEIYRCYTDYAISGTIMERPGLQNLLQDARAGKFDIIVAEALDRLSRDQADMATIFKRMKFAGVDIITLSEGPVGLLDIGLRGTMNQLYSIETANKVRRGQIGRIRAGRPAGARRYGYDIIRKVDAKGDLVRGELQINDREAQIVRRIYREYTRGRSPRAIAHRLNKEGIPGPVGKPWTAHAISGHTRLAAGILNNEMYIGIFLWNRRRHVTDPETGKKVFRTNPQSEWIRGEAPDMRIIDQQLWEKVRNCQQERSCPQLATRLAERKRGQALGVYHPKFLLSGLLRCGCCGGSFVMRRQDKLSCSKHHQSGTCSNHLQIRRTVLEQTVLFDLKRHLTADPERFAVFCEAYARQMEELKTEGAGLAKGLRGELTRVEAEYDQLTNARRRGKPPRDPEAVLKPLIERHKVLTRELNRVLLHFHAFGNHYGEYVRELVDTIRCRRGQNSYSVFRSQIGQVVLTPNDDGTELLVSVSGEPPAQRDRYRHSTIVSGFV